MTSPAKKISYSRCRGYRPTPHERVTILSYALHAWWEPAWGYICVSSFWVKPEVKAPSIEYECVTPHFLLSIIGRGWASKSAIALNISQLCLSPVVNLFLDGNPVPIQKCSSLKTQRMSCHITLKGHGANWLDRCLDQRSGKISLKDRHHLLLSWAPFLSWSIMRPCYICMSLFQVEPLKMPSHPLIQSSFPLSCTLGHVWQ